jgi:hypothetical protein
MLLPAEQPFELLGRLADRRASGELICVGPSHEIHVYLQYGRVAWATDSLHPLAFTRHLKTAASISDDSLREVLDECRRSRLPLGETLVAWSLATHEQVRTSLRHQIEEALEALRDVPGAQAVFLERTEQYADYRADLTFDLGDVTPSPTPRPSTTPPPSEAAHAFVKKLRDANDFGWVELFDGAGLRARAPGDLRAGRLPDRLLRHTLLDGATLAALRTPHAAIVGVTLPTRSRSLWCFVKDDTSFGAAVSTLGVLATEPERPSRALPLRGGVVRWGDAGRESDLVGEFVTRAAEVRAVVVCRSPGEAVLGAVRSELTPSWVTDVVRQRSPALACAMPADAETSDDELTHLGFRSRSLVTAEEDAWAFGIELGAEHERSLWLFLDRSSPQGLGWAYLTSLSRRMARSREDDR